MVLAAFAGALPVFRGVLFAGAAAAFSAAEADSVSARVGTAGIGSGASLPSGAFPVSSCSGTISADAVVCSGVGSSAAFRGAAFVFLFAIVYGLLVLQKAVKNVYQRQQAHKTKGFLPPCKTAAALGRDCRIGCCLTVRLPSELNLLQLLRHTLVGHVAVACLCLLQAARIPHRVGAVASLGRFPQQGRLSGQRVGWAARVVLPCDGFDILGRGPVAGPLDGELLAQGLAQLPEEDAIARDLLVGGKLTMSAIVVPAPGRRRLFQRRAAHEKQDTRQHERSPVFSQPPCGIY